MQPSTWNDTNQHWVPRFLLKGFGLKGNASRVWEFDKQTGLAQIRKVKDVASEQRLMTESDDELMSQIEIRASRPIDLIRKKQLRITERNRSSIDQLVVAMLQNDPYNGFDEEKARRDAINSITRSVKEAVGLCGGVFEPGTLESFVDQRLNHDYLTLTLGGENSVVPLMLSHMGLQAIYAAEGECFIIGDSPVLAVRNSVGTAESSLLNPGSQVILPISSQCILLYDWATAPNLINHGGTIDSRQLLSLNHDYSHNSNCRFLYGRSEESLTGSRQLSLNWGNPERSTEVSKGWVAMQQYLAGVQAKNAERDKRNEEYLRVEARELVMQAARQNQVPG